MERSHSPLPCVVNAYLFQAPNEGQARIHTRHSAPKAPTEFSWLATGSHGAIMCVPRSTAMRTLVIAATGVTLGLMLPSHAQADKWWVEAAQRLCAGHSVQDGMGTDPKKGTVGSACLVKDADYTGSIARPNYSGNDGWVIGPVSAAMGDAEHDASSYVRRAQ
jgi:hypothetical protein